MSLSTFQPVSCLLTSKFCLLLDLLVVSSGCLGNNGYPMSISAFHFCLFFSFSLSASDLVSHDQTQFGSLSGRSHTVVVRFSSFCCFEVIFQLEERLRCYPIRFFLKCRPYSPIDFCSSSVLQNLRLCCYPPLKE